MRGLVSFEIRPIGHTFADKISHLSCVDSKWSCLKYWCEATCSVKSRFGNRLWQLRDERDYSQEELAERADLRRNYIGVVERGEQNVALENIVNLAKALSVPPGGLFVDSS